MHLSAFLASIMIATILLHYYKNTNLNLTRLGGVPTKEKSQKPWSEGATVMERMSLKALMVLQNCSATLTLVPSQMWGKDSHLRERQTWTIAFVSLQVYESYNSMQRQWTAVTTTATHTTKGTPTRVGLHTRVQVLSKENEIWMINNK